MWRASARFGFVWLPRPAIHSSYAVMTEGICQKGSDCVYRHINPTQNKGSEECPYYERGFCKFGVTCGFIHTPKYICEDYMYGFCPKGPECELYHQKVHIKSVIADNETTLKILANFPEKENWTDKNAFTVPTNPMFPGQKPMRRPSS